MNGFSTAPAYRTPNFILSSHDHDRVSPMMDVQSGAPISQAYPAANLAMYVPFVLEHPVTVYETWVETGTLTTSNGIEIGVYDEAFNRLFTQATTVAVASDTANSSGMTDYVLQAGGYYLGFACDGTRAFLTTNFAAGVYSSVGCLEQTGLTGANLPSTMSGVAFTRTQLPIFGLNLRADAL